MFTALDKNGNKISILNADKSEHYICPGCKEPLIIKSGNIRCHHFAHQRNSNCNFDKNNDMSIWHINWQNRFPIETQEIERRFGDSTHRADVLLEKPRIVIEFQHSPISVEDFKDRNNTYVSLGYRVVWLCDVEEDFQKGRFIYWNRNYVRWNWQPTTFKNIDLHNGMVEIYFQIVNDPNDREIDSKITSFTAGIGHPMILKLRNTIYMDNHEFTVNLPINNDVFSSMHLDQINNEKSIPKDDLADTLEPVARIGKDIIVLKTCPLSPHGHCVNNNHNLDSVLKRLYRSCNGCPYSMTKDGKYLCSKRIDDLLIPDGSFIINSQRDDDFKISEISYKFENRVVDISVPRIDLHSKKSLNLFLQWNVTNPKMATYKRLKSEEYYRINKDPEIQLINEGKIMCKVSVDKYHFDGEYVELEEWDVDDWKMIWCYK